MNRRYPSLRVVSPLLVAGVLFFAPRAVHACAVCFGGQGDDTRMAFILTTAFMTSMPLLMVGGIVWWLRRRFRELDREAVAAASKARAAPARSRAKGERPHGIPASFDSPAV